MALILLDAGVWMKILLPGREHGSNLALEVWKNIQAGADELLQPPHWLAEVGAVLARLSPATVQRDLASLCAMEVPIEDSSGVYMTAALLSQELNHHMFDTLYHTVALVNTDAILLTADAHYARKASTHGRIELLA